MHEAGGDRHVGLFEGVVGFGEGQCIFVFLPADQMVDWDDTGGTGSVGACELGWREGYGIPREHGIDLLLLEEADHFGVMIGFEFFFVVGKAALTFEVMELEAVLVEGERVFSASGIVDSGWNGISLHEVDMSRACICVLLVAERIEEVGVHCCCHDCCCRGLSGCKPDTWS